MINDTPDYARLCQGRPPVSDAMRLDIPAQSVTADQSEVPEPEEDLDPEVKILMGMKKSLDDQLVAVRDARSTTGWDGMNLIIDNQVVIMTALSDLVKTFLAFEDAVNDIRGPE